MEMYIPLAIKLLKYWKKFGEILCVSPLFSEFALNSS